MSFKSFAKGATSLASGTIAAQALTFAFTFLLARLYGEAEFGKFAVFMSCLGILGVLSTASYDKAVMFARSPRRFAALITLVAALAAGVALMITVSGLVCLVSGIASPFGLTAFEHTVALPVAAFLYVCGQLSASICLKHDQLSRLAILKVAQSTLMGTTQSILAALIRGSGLVLGQVAGFALMAAPAIGFLRQHLVGGMRRTWLRMRTSAGRFKRYPRFVFPSELVDALSSQAPLLVIGSVFSLEVLGAYAFAQRILAAPAALVGVAVGQAYLQQIGRRELAVAEIRRLTVHVWVSLAALGVVPFVLVFLFGETLFTLVFGEAWRSAGLIAAASAPLLLLRFISSPTSSIYYRLELQSWQFALTIMALLARTLPVFTHLMGASIVEVIYLQTVGELLVILTYNFVAWRRLSVRRA